MARVTIFHTSDMHNKLTPELAERLREIKTSEPGSLMLDSGDAIWAGNAFWRPGGEPVLDLMNSVPYDALCMGNREYHFLGIGCSSKTARAEFPVLSANLVSKQMRPHPSPLPQEREHVSGRPKERGQTVEGSHVLRYFTVDRGGIRVTVFGLSVPCVTERMAIKRLSDFYFRQPLAVAEEIVPELKANCDVLIALTHIGIKVDRELAERAPGIDLILGGHTHVLADERVGDTRILHHGFYVHQVGRVDIDVESGRVDVKNELIPVGKA